MMLFFFGKSRPPKFRLNNFFRVKRLSLLVPAGTSRLLLKVLVGWPQARHQGLVLGCYFTKAVAVGAARFLIIQINEIEAHTRVELLFSVLY